MLDDLKAVCNDTNHFNAVMNVIAQFASVVKNTFGGPVEQTIADVVTVIVNGVLQEESVPVVPAAPAQTTTQGQ